MRLLPCTTVLHVVQDGTTALYDASSRGDTAIVRVLLGVDGVLVNQARAVSLRVRLPVSSTALPITAQSCPVILTGYDVVPIWSLRRSMVSLQVLSAGPCCVYQSGWQYTSAGRRAWKPRRLCEGTGCRWWGRELGVPGLWCLCGPGWMLCCSHQTLIRVAYHRHGAVCPCVACMQST
jgi:hypothetical protein